VAQYILEDAGAEIIVARNGLESVELFEQSESDSFDVILMDVMMPVMDGLTATKRIRKLKRKDARTVPVIAMTANVFNEDIIAAKEAGMNEHIAKPLDFDKLIHTLAKYFLKMDKKLIS
jgi:CheY-like chemotaxis protein